MEILLARSRSPRRLGILSGTFNPPTLAHLALAKAALQRVDEVLFVLPRNFPHKSYHGATLDQRCQMLRQTLEPDSLLGLAVSDGGLFIDIARETRRHYPEAELWFLCGADAAERIIHWDYGTPDAFLRMLDEFGLLVARRGTEYRWPAEFSHRVEALPMDSYDEVSSTAVRQRIAAGADWKPLVPPEIQQQVAAIYSS